jgi:hypothetical protein
MNMYDKGFTYWANHMNFGILGEAKIAREHVVPKFIWLAQ